MNKNFLASLSLLMLVVSSVGGATTADTGFDFAVGKYRCALSP